MKVFKQGPFLYVPTTERNEKGEQLYVQVGSNGLNLKTSFKFTEEEIMDPQYQAREIDL